MHAPSLPETPLISLRNVAVTYPGGRGKLWRPAPPFRAIDNISFDVAPGETLGIVGESGSGKSTIGRAILGRIKPAEGHVLFRGEEIGNLSREALRQLRQHIQPVLQDPYSSLNPRMRIGEIISEPILVHETRSDTASMRQRVADLLDLVGLPADFINRHPAGLSGGQRQRVGIARALAARPDFIVADEPVSALDVSIRAQIVNLFQDLQKQLGVAYLFIAHDLAVVRHIAHRVAVVYAGNIVEIGESRQLYAAPRHPYTRALLDAVPIPDPSRRAATITTVQGELDLGAPAKGCRFAPRCSLATEQCRNEAPALNGPITHQWACWNSPV